MFYFTSHCLPVVTTCSFLAVGNGCPMLSNELDSSRQTVEYFIQGGVFFASTACRPGSTFSDLYSSAGLIRCSNSAWSNRLSRCIGKR